MNIVQIVVAILISWGIITLFSIARRRSTRNAELIEIRFAGTAPRDDDQVKALTTIPLTSDVRVLHLWPAMDFYERSGWHGLMRKFEAEEQRQDKEENELSNYDRSTEMGENAFLKHNERLELQRERLIIRARERIDSFVNRIRERLDDEARVSRYLGDRALLSFQQARRNSDRVTEIQISKYMQRKRFEHRFGVPAQQKGKQHPSAKV